MRVGKVASALWVLALVHLGSAAAAAQSRPSIMSAGQIAQNVSDIVWCYDEERDLVSRKPAWKCTGEIIDETRAKKIQSRRIRRIQGLLKKPVPLFEGQRLRGTGTGFFITDTGTILTNWHVIDKCKGISFTPAGGKALVTELVASDKSKDLALLRAPFAPAGVASFRFLQQLDLSEDVFVVGYPLHGKVAIKPILVSGYVSAAENGPRPGRYPMKIDVRRGNSGGPVLDRAGRVVGVVVAKVNTLDVYAATGRLIQNIGIAIRLSVAMDFMREHGVMIMESPTRSPLTEAEIFTKAHQFVGQVGCWR
jgi:S1-C subfamily serine protease